MQISFSGTHGTGKSTAASLEYRHQKTIHPGKSVGLLCDLEAYCPLPINKKTSIQAQGWLFAYQLRKEIEARQRFDIVVTDRTLIDIIAYTFVAGFEILACSLLGVAEQYIQFYDDITIKQARFNNHLHPDGIRDTDPDFRASVEFVLKDLYHQLRSAGALHGNLYFR